MRSLDSVRPAMARDCASTCGSPLPRSWPTCHGNISTWSSPYEGFLALNDATPIVRYLELPKGTTALRVQLPLRILAVPSRTRRTFARLDVEREWRLLR